MILNVDKVSKIEVSVCESDICEPEAHAFSTLGSV